VAGPNDRAGGRPCPMSRARFRIAEDPCGAFQEGQARDGDGSADPP
jgi:hypothetical protein